MSNQAIKQLAGLAVLLTALSATAQPPGGFPYYTRPAVVTPPAYPGYLIINLPSSNAVVRIYGQKTQGTGLQRSFSFSDLKPGETRQIPVEVDYEKGDELIRGKFEVHLTYGKLLETSFDFKNAEHLDIFPTQLADSKAQAQRSRDELATAMSAKLKEEPDRIESWGRSETEKLNKSTTEPRLKTQLQKVILDESLEQQDKVESLNAELLSELKRQEENLQTIHDELQAEYDSRGPGSLTSLRRKLAQAEGSEQKRAAAAVEALRTELTRLSQRRSSFQAATEVDRAEKIDGYLVKTLRPWYNESLRTYQVAQNELRTELIAPLEEALENWEKRQISSLRRAERTEDNEVLKLAKKILDAEKEQRRQDIASAERALNKILYCRKDYARTVHDLFASEFRIHLNVDSATRQQNKLRTDNEAERAELLAEAKGKIASVKRKHAGEFSALEMAKEELAGNSGKNRGSEP